MKPSNLDITDAIDLLRTQPKTAQDGAYWRVASWLERVTVEQEDRRQARNMGATLAYYRRNVKHDR